MSAERQVHDDLMSPYCGDGQSREGPVGDLCHDIFGYSPQKWRPRQDRGPFGVRGSVRPGGTYRTCQQKRPSLDSPAAVSAFAAAVCAMSGQCACACNNGKNVNRAGQECALCDDCSVCAAECLPALVCIGATTPQRQTPRGARAALVERWSCAR